jgi:hypothetical protein
VRIVTSGARPCLAVLGVVRANVSVTTRACNSRCCLDVVGIVAAGALPVGADARLGEYMFAFVARLTAHALVLFKIVGPVAANAFRVAVFKEGGV